MAAALVIFVGCAEPALVEEQQPVGPDDSGPAGPSSEDEVLRFRVPEVPRKERWANGTFTIADHGYPIGKMAAPLTQQRPYRREIDITEDLPRGGPALVVAEVHAQLRPGQWPQGGDLDLGLAAAPEDLLNLTTHSPYGGHNRLQAWVRVQSEQPIQVVLIYDESDPSVSFTYSLQISVQTFPQIVPAGVPVSVFLEPGDQLLVEATEGQSEIVVWTPSDRVATRLVAAPRAAWWIPQTEEPGDFVLMPTAASGPAKLRLANLTRSLQALSVEWVPGAPHPVAPNAETKWHLDAPGSAVAIGLWIYGTQKPFLCNEFQATVTNPGDEKLLELSWSDTACGGISPHRDFGIFIQTRRGDERVGAGTYEFSVHGVQSVNLEAQDWFLRYVR